MAASLASFVGASVLAGTCSCDSDPPFLAWTVLWVLGMLLAAVGTAAAHVRSERREQLGRGYLLGGCAGVLVAGLVGIAFVLIGLGIYARHCSDALF